MVALSKFRRASALAAQRRHLEGLEPALGSVARRARRENPHRFIRHLPVLPKDAVARRPPLQCGPLER